jgi:hypothetical protein
VQGNTNTTSQTVLIINAPPVEKGLVYSKMSLTITGETSPNAQVVHFVFSKPKMYVTQADGEGHYSVIIPLKDIPKGTHKITAISFSSKFSLAQITKSFLPLIQKQVVLAAETTPDNPRISTVPQVLVVNTTSTLHIFLSAFAGGLTVLVLLAIAYYGFKIIPPRRPGA